MTGEKILPDLIYAGVTRPPSFAMSEMFALLAAVFGAWFVFDALRARENAVRIAREACKEHGLQLLDDTVHGARLSIARDVEGLARLRRTFVFEFSEDG